METLQNIEILTDYLSAHKSEIAQKADEFADAVVRIYQNGGKLISAGNGGSAADAQHIAAELIGRFLKERPSLSAICLNCNVSILTSLGNDYGYNTIFSRQIEGLCSKKDIVFLYSTSGNSKNILTAAESAKKIGAQTVSFTGCEGGILKQITDFNFNAHIHSTPRTQELHALMNHLICERIENILFN